MFRSWWFSVRRVSGQPQDQQHQKHDDQHADYKTKPVAPGRQIFDLLSQETNFIFG
jgi:hypothetical protein